MRIANNVVAMNTHRSYILNNDKVQSSAEKLSSGFRINRAGDDAAGLAISEKMRSQIRGLNMATRNSQDAVSLIQTAEGALQEAHSMLQRMNELAVQSATGTNESFDRTQIAKEFEQLKREINDISDQTTFNNMKILDGSLSAGGLMRTAYTSGVYARFTPDTTPPPGPAGIADVTLYGAEKYRPSGTRASFELDMSGVKVTANETAKITVGAAEVTVAAGAADLSGEALVNAVKDAINAQNGLSLAVGPDRDPVLFEASVNGGKLTLTADTPVPVNAKDITALAVKVEDNAGGSGVTGTAAIKNAVGDDTKYATIAKSSFTFDHSLTKSGDAFSIGKQVFTFYNSDTDDLDDETKAKYASDAFMVDLAQITTAYSLADQIGGVKEDGTYTGAQADELVKSDMKIHAVASGNRIDITYIGNGGSNRTDNEKGFDQYGTVGDGHVAVDSFTAGQKATLAEAAKTAAAAGAQGASRIGGVGSARAAAVPSFISGVQEISKGKDFVKAHKTQIVLDISKLSAYDTVTEINANQNMFLISNNVSDPNFKQVNVQSRAILKASDGPITAERIANSFQGSSFMIGGHNFKVAVKKGTDGSVGLIWEHQETVADDIANGWVPTNVEDMLPGATISLHPLTQTLIKGDVPPTPVIEQPVAQDQDATIAQSTFNFSINNLLAGDSITVGDKTILFTDGTPTTRAGGADFQIDRNTITNAATFADALNDKLKNDTHAVFFENTTGNTIKVTYIGTGGTDAKGTGSGNFGSIGSKMTKITANLGGAHAATVDPSTPVTPGSPSAGGAGGTGGAGGSGTSTRLGGTTTFEIDVTKLKNGDTLSYNNNGTVIDHTYRVGQTAADIMSAFGVKDGIDGNSWSIRTKQDETWRLKFDPVADFKSYDPMKIQVGALQGEQLSIKITAMNTAGLGLDNVSIYSQQEAGSAVTATRSAINAVSDQRALLGAMQNRITHKVANLKVSIENLQASESRIRDIDIASEMTTFTKNNILSQAATSMLAQANNMPQNVLSLLR